MGFSTSISGKQILLARVEMVADVLEYRAAPEASELANASRFVPLWRVRVQSACLRAAMNACTCTIIV